CWQHLFREARAPQVICKRDGHVRELNDAAARAFGLTRRSRLLEGSLFHPSTTAQLRKVLARDVSGPESITAVGVNVPDGTCLVADLRLTELERGLWLVGV